MYVHKKAIPTSKDTNKHLTALARGSDRLLPHLFRMFREDPILPDKETTRKRHYSLYISNLQVKNDLRKSTKTQQHKYQHITPNTFQKQKRFFFAKVTLASKSPTICEKTDFNILENPVFQINTKRQKLTFSQISISEKKQKRFAKKFNSLNI